MEPIIQSVSQSVAQDMRELVHAVELQEQILVEMEPPGFQWQWHLPLGFLSLVAAGALLVAAGGVQWRVQEQKHGARHPRTRLHKKQLKVVPSSPLRSYAER